MKLKLWLGGATMFTRGLKSQAMEACDGHWTSLFRLATPIIAFAAS